MRTQPCSEDQQGKPPDTIEFWAGRGYKMLRLIGKGSFGAAMLARNTDGSQCVIKAIDLSNRGQKTRELMSREAELMKQLQHPYIVRFRDSFMEESMLAIVMDFAGAGDLRQQIHAAKHSRMFIPERRLIRWTTQVLLALKYMHSLKIIHRDLKAENIFLETLDQVRVGDLGIACRLNTPGTIVVENKLVGTPYYLSPEVCSMGVYSAASDIWAVGVVLFELANLEVPFHGSSLSDLISVITTQPIPRFPSSYSPELADVYTELLMPKRSLRPSARTLLQRRILRSMTEALLEEVRAQVKERSTSESLSQQACKVDHGLEDVRMQPPLPKLIRDESHIFKRSEPCAPTVLLPRPCRVIQEEPVQISPHPPLRHNSITPPSEALLAPLLFPQRKIERCSSASPYERRSNSQAYSSHVPKMRPESGGGQQRGYVAAYVVSKAREHRGYTSSQVAMSTTSTSVPFAPGGAPAQRLRELKRQNIMQSLPQHSEPLLPNPLPELRPLPPKTALQTEQRMQQASKWLDEARLRQVWTSADVVDQPKPSGNAEAEIENSKPPGHGPVPLLELQRIPFLPKEPQDAVQGSALSSVRSSCSYLAEAPGSASGRSSSSIAMPRADLSRPIPPRLNLAQMSIPSTARSKTSRRGGFDSARAMSAAAFCSARQLCSKALPGARRKSPRHQARESSKPRPEQLRSNAHAEPSGESGGRPSLKKVLDAATPRLGHLPGPLAHYCRLSVLLPPLSARSYLRSSSTPPLRTGAH